MTYIVGGTPRSGKTALRNLFLEKYKIPGLCTDYPRDALEHEVPGFGIKDGMSDAEKSEILWPYFKGILDQRNKYYKDNLLIEGTNFLPKYLKGFVSDLNIRIVFLGYAEVRPEEKYKSIRNLPSPHDEWTSDLGHEELKTMVDEFIEISKYFRSECTTYGIRYFDTSSEFDSVIERAASYLIGNVG